MKKFNPTHSVHKSTGTVTISQDMLYSMLASAIQSRQVENKYDMAAYITGYLTGDKEFGDKIQAMIHRHQ